MCQEKLSVGFYILEESSMSSQHGSKVFGVYSIQYIAGISKIKVNNTNVGIFCKKIVRWPT